MKKEKLTRKWVEWFNNEFLPICEKLDRIPYMNVDKKIIENNMIDLSILNKGLLKILNY